ncbi:hypothetical protein GCM10007989_34290 [Devosia pacifica]|uniref:Tetratricopeptide repeat protein n=1 Tax=Devosia pacifica TaxID=1335967 RepID=A0A918SF14_9HYPH|nr:tetratricopeptide repeat protein [Devosia pacifica]GHA35480.1 hypothetical protein GCM10007989_34290 [Devosia pacifica]
MTAALAGSSIGVIGALKAFPLRAAARRAADRGGRLHRGLPRGTTIAVFCRSLLLRHSADEIEHRVDAANDTVATRISESGLMRLLGALDVSAPGAIGRDALVEQSGLPERTLDMLALFDAFEHHAEPFSFRDAILARKYAGLIHNGADWYSIARAVHSIGPVGSLTALTLETHGERILAQDAHSLAELDGQRLLPLPQQDDAAEDYFAHAETAEAEGMFAEAATLYAHCSATDPADATAPFNEGNCRRELGQYEDAVTAYITAIKRDPLMVEAWFNCGNVLRELGRLSAAHDHLLRAVEIDAGYADAVYNIAALNYEMGRMDEAAAGWRRYLELDPRSDWARKARAGIAIAAQNRSRTG